MKKHVRGLVVIVLIVLGYEVSSTFLGAAAASVMGPVPVQGASEETVKIHPAISPEPICWAELSGSGTSGLPANLVKVGWTKSPGTTKLNGWPGFIADDSALFIEVDPEDKAKSWVLFYDVEVSLFYLSTDGRSADQVIWDQEYLDFGLVCSDSTRRDLYLQFDQKNLRWTAFAPLVLPSD